MCTFDVSSTVNQLNKLYKNKTVYIVSYVEWLK